MDARTSLPVSLSPLSLCLSLRFLSSLSASILVCVCVCAYSGVPVCLFFPRAFAHSLIRCSCSYHCLLFQGIVADLDTVHDLVRVRYLGWSPKFDEVASFLWFVCLCLFVYVSGCLFGWYAVLSLLSLGFPPTHHSPLTTHRDLFAC